jgi:transcriptional regulator with GAF, ATPase, and Fis domain
MVEKMVFGPEIWEKVISSPIFKQASFFLSHLFKRQFGFADFSNMGITREGFERIRGPIAKSSVPLFDFCALINETKIGAERCSQEDNKVFQAISTTKEKYLHPCHAGIMAMTVPIIIEEHYYGCVTIKGGLLLHPPNKNEWIKISQQVKDTGVDLEKLRDAYFQIAPASQELLEVMFKLLSIIIEEIAKNTLEVAADKKKISELESILIEKYHFANIIGKSSSMLEIYRLLDRIKDTQYPVLIQGETGTGKELVARVIHYNSPRKDKPFVIQNCAALSESLLESELFGHVKGAFTGAIKDHKGIFESANGGTIFLDEVSEMTPQMQAKLLRVIEYGEIKRLGDEKSFKVDVRIISATNKDLKKLTQEGNFREDLYYRLKGILINLPPLRERKEDIPILINHFINKNTQETGKKLSIDMEALKLLYDYDWPGNIRELENEIQHGIIFSQNQITANILSKEIRKYSKNIKADEIIWERFAGKNLLEIEDAFAKEVLRKTLEKANWNQALAAKMLGIPRPTLHHRIKRYGLKKIR